MNYKDYLEMICESSDDYKKKQMVQLGLTHAGYGNYKNSKDVNYRYDESKHKFVESQAEQPKAEPKTDMTVAKTILHQLGGNRFIAMTGAKNLAGDATSLSFKIGKNAGKVTHVTVNLNSMDLYDVTYYNIRGVNVKIIKQSDGLYSDMLQSDFTNVTGMYTHL